MFEYQPLNGQDRDVGAGAFGRVIKVLRKSDEKVVACKIISYRGNDKLDKKAKDEYVILSGLNHPNIARFIDVEWRLEEARLYMELYEFGSLRHLIETRKQGSRFLPESYVWSIMYQISSALMFCHHGIKTSITGPECIDASKAPRRVLHRDIKPENIFLASRSETALDAIKLGDFGVGVILQDGRDPSTYAGTSQYIAPEIQDGGSGQNIWSDKCDIFSLGCTIYEACTLDSAFTSHVETRSKIKHFLGGRYSRDLEMCMQRCLSFHGEDRPDARELFNKVRGVICERPEHQQNIRNYELLSAAEGADFLKTMRLLEEGANINARDDMTGETPLHKAIKYGDVAFVTFLLGVAADSTLVTKSRQTILHVAASSANTWGFDTLSSLIQILIKQGAELQTYDNLGWTALHVAAAGNHTDAAAALLDQGSDLEAVTAGPQRLTALHIAAEKGNDEMLTLLMDRGANIKGRRSDDQTALHVAAGQGHANIVRSLISFGALPDDKAAGIRGSTALHVASQAGRKHTALALIEANAKVKTTISGGETALHLAARNGHDALIDILVDKGAKVEARCSRSRTPLHLAAEYGHVCATETMLRNGANIRAQTNGETVLHLAARKGHLAIIGILVGKGLDVNVKGRWQSTPLHSATGAGLKEVVQCLLSSGADPSRKTHFGDGVLHRAASCGQAEIIDYLLQEVKGIDINTRNLNGETALYCAIKHGHWNCLSPLLVSGASVSVKAADGKTPLELARQKGVPDEYLRMNT